MNNVSILLMQIAASLLTSLAVIIYIGRVLAHVLSASCSEVSGQFWLRILNLLLVFAPLLLVVLTADPVTTGDIFPELRKIAGVVVAGSMPFFVPALASNLEHVGFARFEGQGGMR